MKWVMKLGYITGMAEREQQFITMSRQGIFAATAMGVGLLTFCYVIGVQVGKRSLTQKNVRIKTIDEELKELPEPLSEQLKLFSSIESGGSPRRSDRQRQGAPSQGVGKAAEPSNTASTVAASAPNPSAPAPAPAPAPASASVSAPITQKTIGATEKYTAQVIATSSIDTANRVSGQLKSAGYSAKVVLVDGLYKVQLDWSLTRAELDARVPRLRSLGYEPLAVKIQ